MKYLREDVPDRGQHQNKKASRQINKGWIKLKAGYLKRQNKQSSDILIKKKIKAHNTKLKK